MVSKLPVKLPEPGRGVNILAARVPPVEHVCGDGDEKVITLGHEGAEVSARHRTRRRISSIPGSTFAVNSRVCSRVVRSPRSRP